MQECVLDQRYKYTTRCTHTAPSTAWCFVFIKQHREHCLWVKYEEQTAICEGIYCVHLQLLTPAANTSLRSTRGRFSSCSCAFILCYNKSDANHIVHSWPTVFKCNLKLKFNVHFFPSFTASHFHIHFIQKKKNSKVTTKAADQQSNPISLTLTNTGQNFLMAIAFSTKSGQLHQQLQRTVS